MTTDDLAAAVDAVAGETGFSGVVRVDRDGSTLVEVAYGLARRDLGVPNTVTTRFAIASGGKGLTALAVVRLIEDGALALDTPARAFLGRDLPLIPDDVTVEHLLAHRSGIGDYVDESSGGSVDDFVLPIPVQRLEGPEDFLPILDDHPSVFAPDARFAYNNSGYVVLALIAERAGGVPFHQQVEQRVCAPAGMADTTFLRSDELPADAAVGYLAAEGLRSNLFHLPVRGNGDGGIYSTAADLLAFWDALFGGRIVAPEWMAKMTRARSEVPEESKRYGLGFWLAETGDPVLLEGYDAGVSFRSVHDPTRALTHTVVANTSAGAWPVTRLLGEQLGT